MSPTFPNVTDMSALLIIHGECLSHLSPRALIESEASNPPSSFTTPFNTVLPITVQVEIKKWAAG